MADLLPAWINEAAQRELGANSPGAVVNTLNTLAEGLDEVGVSAADIDREGDYVCWGPYRRYIIQGNALQAVFDLVKDIHGAQELEEKKRQEAAGIGAATRERDRERAEARDRLEQRLPDA